MPQTATNTIGPPQSIHLETVTTLQNNVNTQQILLQQIIATFEKRYNCSLAELEHKLNNLDIDEHPAWEDSIAWRNAVEQLEQIKHSETIFSWLQALLTQSTTS